MRGRAGKGLPDDPALHAALNARKQRHTLETTFPRDERLVALFAALKKRGFKASRATSWRHVVPRHCRAESLTWRRVTDH